MINCGRQEEPAILISRLLLRMRRMYAAGCKESQFHSLPYGQAVDSMY